MTIIGVPALRLKNAARSRRAVRGPVHAEQRGGPGDAAAVQQVADGHEGRSPVHAFLAAEVDGELRLLVGPARLNVTAPMSPASSRARSRVTSPVPVIRAVGSTSGFDPLPGVDGDRDQRQVLRQGQ